jgi:hypothetical protein
MEALTGNNFSCTNGNQSGSTIKWAAVGSACREDASVWKAQE